MAGIVSMGAYVPRLRLERSSVHAAMGWYNPFSASLARGTKAVAYYDEDSLTMAVAAGLDCISGLDRSKIGKLIIASTTLPYQERLNSSIAVHALDLADTTGAFDLSGSVRAGLDAVVSAAESLASGSDSQVLVCASDTRLGKPGSSQEHMFGDGAASVLIGTEDVKAEFLAWHTKTLDFPDRRRFPGDRFDMLWEERWVRDAGQAKIMPSVIKDLLEKAGVTPQEVSKIVIPVNSRLAGSIAARLGFSKGAVQQDLSSQIGDTGTAYPLMLLCSALEDANEGDKILAASFGSGTSAVLLEVKEPLKRHGHGMNAAVDKGVTLDNYEKYCVFRDIVPREVGIRAELQPPTSLSVLYRERATVFGLYGSRCTQCGTPQFPPQRVCANPSCKAIDKMEPYRFAEKKATVFTYTGDMLAVSPDPPQIYGVVDFEGGGRAWLDFTDCKLEDVEVGMPVELSFRRKYVDPERSITGYFWKAVPQGGGKEG